jgi:hypothetical protein
MADGRRYHDDEVREIFDLAARRDRGGQPTVPDEGGLMEPVPDCVWRRRREVRTS